MNAPHPDAPARAHRLDALPFDNSFARLPAAFYTRLAPWGLPEPRLVAVSDAAAALIGLHPEEIGTPAFVAAFAGNAPLPGSDTLAAVYSGHQFGAWAGQLGDGRAHLLGEVRTPHGPWELQLKGAGRTPYSRMGDGRAVLRSSIREFLCSEAMAALGTPTTRPSGTEVAEALARGGYPLTMLRASRQTNVGRRYVATTRSGDSLEVVVLDRDLEGAGLANAAWKALRLREEPGRGAFNMRRELDHAALMAYAAQAAGAPVPRLLITSEIGPDSSLLAYEYTVGTRFSDLDADQITEADLEGAWRAMRLMHEHQMAHRSLTAEHLLRDRAGDIWLLGESSGSVAASDVAMRIDVAELLCTLAMVVGPDRAVRSGRRVLGVQGLARALPVLQPVAFNPVTRKAMRKRRDLMVHLRDALVEIRPDGALEQIDVERIKPRTLIMIVVGTIAAYVLLSQLAQVDLGELLTTASLEWLAVAFIASLITYVGAAWSLVGFVPERIPLHRTMMAQVAGDFATLVSPPTLGAIAINMRFLTKAGLHPALAGASVGVSQVAAFVMHLLLLLGFGIAAGTQADFTFDPPAWAVIAVIAVAILFLSAFAVPRLRRYVFGRVRPLLREVVPRLVTVAQRPLKLVEGVGGILLLNLAYIACLVACVRAFGGDTNIAAIAVVYLAGATIGQAAPPPGGLGAVEAALAAGLTAAGLPGGIAVSSVLLFRLVTFWLPTVPGYLSFNWLTKKGYL